MNRGSPASVGLCFTCVHARRVVTPRSLFWLCRLSATDPRFDRYPRLPMLHCDGWRPEVHGEGDDQVTTEGEPEAGPS